MLFVRQGFSCTHLNFEKFLISRVLCFYFLFSTLTLGVLAKQINAKYLATASLVQNVSLFKSSGLSVPLPSSFLFDNKNSLVEPASTRNVTTQVGQTTYLHCIVDRQEDKTVSWIRLRDFHLLTVGLYTYTSDNRFQTIYNEYSSDWTLQIKYPQQSDEGLYECQISSDPPTSHYVYLKVLVPKAKIIGAPNFYVSAGSSINLTCVISECPEPPAFVFWYHDDRMINYYPSKGNITVQKAGEDMVISKLHIRNAQPAHSGNYSCCPSNADSANIFVHVLKGEKHAAVQNDAASTSKSARFSSSFLVSFVLSTLLLLRFHNSCGR